MGGDLRRWIVLVVILLFVVGMLIWARGAEHHRGQDVGALGGAWAGARESLG